MILKILLADDEPLSALALEKQIRELFTSQIITMIAQDGVDAIQKNEKFIPELAILDIEMPILNGIEAAKIIKKQNPKCHIIFLTAYQKFEYALSALKIHATDYLLKPVDITALYNKIQILFPKLSQIKSTTQINSNPFKIKIETYINNNYHLDISLDEISKIANLNATYFSRLFKINFGTNFLQYLTHYRLQKADELLLHSNLDIKEIAFKCGFKDSNYFAKVYKREKQISPSDFRHTIKHNKS